MWCESVSAGNHNTKMFWSPSFFRYQDTDELVYRWQQQYLSATCHSSTKILILFWRLLAILGIMTTCILVDYNSIVKYVWIARFESCVAVFGIVTLVVAFAGSLAMIGTQECVADYDLPRPRIHSIVWFMRHCNISLSIVALAFYVQQREPFNSTHMGLAASTFSVAAVDFLGVGGAYEFAHDFWPSVVVLVYGALLAIGDGARGATTYESMPWSTDPARAFGTLIGISLSCGAASLGVSAYCKLAEKTPWSKTRSSMLQRPIPGI